ncbi:cytochrome b5 reductase 4 [Fusarium beomiforme]|uniref:Cytochrome b5 reductase 4 n=1 Tax=Fusarium beomiforme TaxID=44412 RepID=A0A9P5DXI2_9HYPO|nr:cytochrome b5 reductase 4 [Fusarium beomiforme]
MGVIGIGLIVASVVWVLVRPPSWMPEPLQVLLRWRGTGPPALAAKDEAESEANDTDPGPRIMVSGLEVEPGPRLRARPADNRTTRDDDQRRDQGKVTGTAAAIDTPTSSLKSAKNDAMSMLPPPLPKVAPPPPIIAEPEEQTTPKAVASDPPSITVPSFSLDNAPIAPSSHPAPRRNPTAPSPALSPNPSMMPPPPPPGRLPLTTSAAPSAGRLPSLSQFPAVNSPQRARGPLPNRGPPASGGLAPPPTHSSKPNKPSRKVLLTPGHSPLDWARISGPNADLRGVEPQTPYLRVTPSMLKRMTGRKGKDAWMALNGKVYNVTPYADFHPGGVPELMRGAGRDGTKLFGEIHPWVNYETMLSACLVGLLVEESEGTESKMDQMD